MLGSVAAFAKGSAVCCSIFPELSALDVFFVVDLENGFLVTAATVGAFVAVQFNDAFAEFFPFAFVIVFHGLDQWMGLKAMDTVKSRVPKQAF